MAVRGLKRETAAWPRAAMAPGCGGAVRFHPVHERQPGRQREAAGGRLHLQWRMQSEPPRRDWLRWEERSHLRPSSWDTLSGHQQWLTEAEAGECTAPPWRDLRGICINPFPTPTLNLAKTWAVGGRGVAEGQRAHLNSNVTEFKLECLRNQ